MFLLVNATLFIRPGELVPALAPIPLYEIVIIANLIVAGPAIINHLTEHGLARCPTTVCVLGVFAFIVISHLARFDLWSARMGALEFGKIVAYFLLLMATVNTPRRLMGLLAAVVVLTLAINTLAMLQYHGYVNIAALEVLMENDYDDLTGEVFQTPRMVGTGIFNDPNDLSMIIVACVFLCAGGLFYQQLGMSRWLLTAPIGFLLYALTLTQSRGGLLALLAGGCTFFYVRFGLTRAVLASAAVLPLAFVGFGGGRQTDIGGALSGGTGEARAELWSAGLQLFKTSPLVGIGYGLYAEEAGQVAHNSFVHAFTELGLLGGMAFLGMFGIVGLALWKLCRSRDEIEHPALRHYLPYVLGMLAAFAISMMSLSRNYVVPTYLVAGTAAAYHRLAQPGTSQPPVAFNEKTITWLAIGSVGFIAFIYFYIKVLHRMG